MPANMNSQESFSSSRGQPKPFGGLGADACLVDFFFEMTAGFFNTAAITRAQLEDKTFGTASIAPGQKETEVRGTGQR